MKLKTLEEYNAERYAALKEKGKLEPNGIACKHCDSEMVDSDPDGFCRASLPPKIRIECPVCGHWDYRLA